MRLVALPYLQVETPPECGPWIVEMRGSRQPLPDVLKGWDYSTALRLECTVRLSRREILAECGLSEDAELSLAVRWSASSTNVRRLGSQVRIEGSRSLNLAFDVPAGTAGGRLALERLIVLNHGGNVRQSLAAEKPGSVLWREPRDDQAVCALEGDAARFPTDVMDFEQTGLGDAGGVWWLHHDLSDLDANPLSCLRIRINSAHPAGSRLVDGSPEASDARSALYWDVNRLLVHAALDSDEFVTGWGAFRVGSLGHTLEQLCRRLWPYQDARALRASRANDRGRFEVSLQARVGLFTEAAG